MRRFVILSAAGVVSALLSPVATAQQTTAAPAPSAQAPGGVAPPQIVWAPTYCRDAAGALWLVYVPSAPAAATWQPPAEGSAPVQRIAPAQPVSAAPPAATPAPAPPAAEPGPGGQASPSLVHPRNPEQGTGRNIRMHKPWMKGRR